jgi:hypothetical protein
MLSSLCSIRRTASALNSFVYCFFSHGFLTSITQLSHGVPIELFRIKQVLQQPAHAALVCHTAQAGEVFIYGYAVHVIYIGIRNRCPVNLTL